MLLLLVGSFALAEYLVQNTPAAAARREARENAAAVRASTAIYDEARRNGYYAPETTWDDDATCHAAPVVALMEHAAH